MINFPKSNHFYDLQNRNDISLETERNQPHIIWSRKQRQPKIPIIPTVKAIKMEPITKLYVCILYVYEQAGCITSAKKKKQDVSPTKFRHLIKMPCQNIMARFDLNLNHILL